MGSLAWLFFGGGGGLVAALEAFGRPFLFHVVEHFELARVFRKYVSPETPVEMLKLKSRAKTICDEFGKGFRSIQKVQAAFKADKKFLATNAPAPAACP